MKFSAAVSSLSFALFASVNGQGQSNHISEHPHGCRAIDRLDLDGGVGDAFDGDCQKCLPPTSRTYYPCNNTPVLCTPECFSDTAPVASPTPAPTARPTTSCRAKTRRELPRNIGASTTGDCLMCLSGQTWYPCNSSRPKLCTPGCYV